MKAVSFPDHIAEALLLLRQQGYTGMARLDWINGDVKVLEVPQAPKRITA